MNDSQEIVAGMRTCEAELVAFLRRNEEDLALERMWDPDDAGMIEYREATVENTQATLALVREYVTAAAALHALDRECDRLRALLGGCA